MNYKKVADVYTNFEYLNSDVQLEKGALLLNMNTGEVIAQLRFCNYSSAKLKSLYIAVEKYDDTGALLDEGNRTSFAYLDLYISKNQTFGDNVAVVLDNALTRNIKVYLIKYKLNEEVVNVENSEIYDYGDDMSQVNSMESEHAGLFDKYHHEIKTSYPKICYALNLGTAWFCSCGKFNFRNDKCVHCGLDKNKQLELLTRENAYVLSDREKQEIIAKEKEKMAAEEERKAKEKERIAKEREKKVKEKEIKRKNLKRIGFIIVGIVVLFIGTGIIFNTIRFIEAKKEETANEINKKKVIVNYSKWSYRGESFSEVECRIVDIADVPVYNIIVEITLYDSDGNELPDKIEHSIDKINANDSVVIREEITNNSSMGNKVSAIIKSYNVK